MAKFSFFQITIDIQSVSSCTWLSESVHWRFIASDTRETAVPFWVNLVSASAASLPTRIALFTLRSAIEFSSSFEIFDWFFGPGQSATCSITGGGGPGRIHLIFERFLLSGRRLVAGETRRESRFRTH